MLEQISKRTLYNQQINEQILGKEKASIVTEAYTKLVTNPSLFFNYADELSQEIAHLYFVCPSRAMARFETIFLVFL